MFGDRSMRNVIAAILLVVALFVAMNLVVSGAPLLDWGLPIVLIAVGLALAFLPSLGRGRSSGADEPPEASDEVVLLVGETVVVTHSAEATAEASAEATAVPPALEAVLPFAEETPEATAEASAEAIAAPSVSHLAQTEFADPEQAVAANEPQPPPAPDDSVTATDHSEPEIEVIAEKTAAPQQAYEVEQVGEITPERVENVVNGDTDDAPVITETASVEIAAEEVESAASSNDDIVRIDGIGEKSAAALRAAGIDSFEKLANSNVETLREAISNAGVRLVGEVDSWAEQASYAARGDWEGMDNFNRERKARDA